MEVRIPTAPKAMADKKYMDGVSCGERADTEHKTCGFDVKSRVRIGRVRTVQGIVYSVSMIMRLAEVFSF